MPNNHLAQPANRVAVLGTGLIGAGVARNLARKGFEVRAWNRSASKAEALAADGVSPCTDILQAVDGAAIILTVLKDGDAVAASMEAALPAIPKGAVWLQLSTVGIAATDRLTSLAAANGLAFYDAPVQGTRQPAEQGKLVILASGPLDERAAAEAIFDAIGQRTIWVSDEAGASSRLKLALNSYVFAITHGVAESLSIAKALGVDPALVIEAITGGPLDSGFFQGKSTAIIKEDYATSFSIENAVKDSQLIIDGLAETSINLDLAVAGLTRFQRAGDAGHGEKDMAATFLA